MAYNVPTYKTQNFSFGPGVLYMGAQGTTPLVEVGQTKGDATLSIERSKLEVKAGSPQVKIEQYVTEESISFKTNGIEWNFDNLAYALGAGVTSASGATETMEFGGDMAVSNRAMRFVHRTPDGSTIDIHFFKVEGAGKIDMSLKETDMHEFPYEFVALEGTTDFSGQALAAKKKLIKIIKTKA